MLKRYSPSATPFQKPDENVSVPSAFDEVSALYFSYRGRGAPAGQSNSPASYIPTHALQSPGDPSSSGNTHLRVTASALQSSPTSTLSAPPWRRAYTASLSSRCCAHSSLCSSRAAAAPPLELPPAASVEVEAAPSPSSSTVVVVVPLPPRRRISRISEILPFASTRILCTRCSYSTRFRFAGCFFLSSPRDSLLAATSGTGRPLSVGPSASSGASSSRTSTAANARSSGGGGASASGFGGGFGFGGAFGRASPHAAHRVAVFSSVHTWHAHVRLFVGATAAAAVASAEASTGGATSDGSRKCLPGVRQQLLSSL